MHAATKYPAPSFTEPVHDDYLYVAWSVDPPKAPVVGSSGRRTEFLDAATAVAAELSGADGVRDVRLFAATLMPPLDGVPRHDVLLLARASDEEALGRLRGSPALSGLGEPALTMPMRNIRRFGDTEAGGPRSSYLFNHFVVQDVDAAVETFDTVSAWYPAKVGVDNTTLLRPTEQAPFGFVNYVRLPGGPKAFMLNQLLRPSFHGFVRRGLAENGMTALPVLYRRA